MKATLFCAVLLALLSVTLSFWIVNGDNDFGDNGFGDNFGFGDNGYGDNGYRDWNDHDNGFDNGIGWD